MSSPPSAPSVPAGPAARSVPASHQRLVADLTARWPEHRVAPSLGRIQAVCELLGDPQHAFPVIHVAGTNGKGSTAIMIESLLRAVGLRTGRFSSPHLMNVTERIAIDGRSISEDRFDEVWADIAPYVQMVDERRIDGVQLTFFEVITAMAFAAFADAPVDVAVLEVGLGGTWDATNVADGSVAVITPIDLDHTHILGKTVGKIATEKAGIIKPGAQAILAGQELDAARVLLERCTEVGALVQREGVDFGLIDRTPGVGGQVLRLNGSDGPVEGVGLPAHGEHQARNAAVALAAVEAFLGMKALNPDVVRDGFAEVRLPGRLEVVRRSPTIVLDGAHNPHGARAAAAGVVEAFGFSPLIGVFAAMTDKDIVGILTIWEPVLDKLVATQVSSTDRGMPAADLGELAMPIFGPERVLVRARMDDAIEAAVELADAEGSVVPGVLVTGSVIGVGEARTLLKPDDHEQDDDPTVEDDGGPELSIGGLDA
ncbi:MAG: bifunctional folylpolyglutamate synthase/dihydrofolate synthase [Propionibacteriaceae bacterium]